MDPNDQQHQQYNQILSDIKSHDQEIKRLILDLKSEDQQVVNLVMTTFRRRSWHFFGAFHNADLIRANLANTDLWGVDMTGANLSYANLSGALLGEAKLEGANLLGTILSQTRLDEARLRGARNLTIEQLRTAKTLEGLTLPDGFHLPRRIEMGDPDPDWQTPFEQWCKTVETDQDGCIFVGAS